MLHFLTGMNAMYKSIVHCQKCTILKQAILNKGALFSNSLKYYIKCYKTCWQYIIWGANVSSCSACHVPCTASEIPAHQILIIKALTALRPIPDPFCWSKQGNPNGSRTACTSHTVTAYTAFINGQSGLCLGLDRSNLRDRPYQMA